jgi:hypothetical protein
MNESAPHIEGPRSFAVFLQQLADGSAHAELSREMHALLEFLHDEAQQRGAAGVASGKLTLTLGFKVETKGVVGIKYDVTTKEPKPERGGDVFWLTKGRNLSKDNPKQQALFPRDVTTKAPLEAPDDDETSIAREAK